MRDDDRRRRQESDEELFSSLLGEIETVQTDAGKDAGGSVFSDPHERDLGPRTPPPPADGSASLAGGAGPTYSASSLADENLGDLPTLGPTGGRQTSRRAGAAARIGGRRPSRLLLLVVAVVLAGAAWMFWPHGQPEPPLGIGERTSVVTRDGARTIPPPATSDVDISAEAPALVPEGGTPPAPPAGSPAAAAKPTATRPPAPAQVAAGAGAAATPRGSAPAANGGVTGGKTGGGAHERPAAAGSASAESPARDPGAGEPAAGEAAGSEPAVNEPAAGASLAGGPAASEPAAGPAPGPDGLWALQLGAFQAQENADKLAAELRGRGLQPMIKTAATSGGGLMFKVWIGYFASRAEAAAYAQRQARLLGGPAQPVHR